MAFELWKAIVLAVVQGITEWLPVSSKGHLIIFERLLNFSGGLDFDIILHFGTLAAVFVYFGGDIVEIIREVLRGNWKSGNGKLGLMIIVATIPAVIVGFLFKPIFEEVFTSLFVTAFGFAVTGIFLLVASFPVKKNKELNYSNAFIVGIAQVFALFPGVSRSGSTIGAGLLSGLNEKNALKFSFLMSIPIIFGANVLAIGNKTLDSSLIWATLVSFVIGLIVIHLLYKKILIDRKNLRWFGGYALLLSLVLFVLIYLGVF
jgi:undecaprenyl-diphosphatase